MSETKLRVKYRKYYCHPETCGHVEHTPWWVTKDDRWLVGFYTEQAAEEYMRTRNAD